MIGAKFWRIRFDKIHGFIRVFVWSRYLIFFSPEKCDAVYNRIKHIIRQESIIMYVFSKHYRKIKFDSYDSLPAEETWALHVILMIKSFLSKHQNHYYYNVCITMYYYNECIILYVRIN